MKRFFVLVFLLAGRLIMAQPLLYQPHHIDRQLPGCGNSKEGCLHVELDWVEAISGSQTVREGINAAIQASLTEKPDDNSKRTLEEFADKVVNAYQAAPKPFHDQSWYVQETVKPLRSTPPVYSFQYSESSFKGGAHPNSGTTYLNFDASTGETATLASVIVDGGLPRLTQIAEAHFRKTRDLAPDADLTAAGFIFFKDGRFSLNNNWGVSQDSLTFFYNAYEVGPYYMGSTEVKIPFSEIRDLLRPGFAN